MYVYAKGGVVLVLHALQVATSRKAHCDTDYIYHLLSLHPTYNQ